MPGARALGQGEVGGLGDLAEARLGRVVRERDEALVLEVRRVALAGLVARGVAVQLEGREVDAPAERLGRAAGHRLADQRVAEADAAPPVLDEHARGEQPLHVPTAASSGRSSASPCSSSRWSTPATSATARRRRAAR